MSSGIAYPPPTYIPPLSVFNPSFFPQSFGTTSSSGGGGGQSNIFPNGLTSGNTISLNGGTGGQGGTGVERTITGISYLDFVDSNSTDPTAITGYMTLDGTTLNIGSTTASSGINVNLLGSVVSANGVPIATGGNVSNNQSNTFQPTFTQTFQGPVVVDNTSLSFSNGGAINLNGGGSSNIIFPSSLPTTSTGLLGGLGVIWNQQGGGGLGETDLICYGQQAGGPNISGLNIYNCNNTNAPVLVASFNANQTNFYSNIASNNTFTGNNYFNTGFINLENITGTFPSTPLGYSQFVSYNGNPWFSPTNGGGVQITTSTSLTTALLPYALLASPTFTGTPTAPTATAGTNTTQLATTAFVSTSFAPKASPALTGVPTAPTATVGTNTTQIATTAFVQSAVGSSSQIINYPSSSTTGTIGTSSTTWQIILIPQTTTAFATPPWGKTFSYKIYTNINSSAYNLSGGSALSVQGLFSSMSGTGVYQPFTQNSTNYWGYVFSQAITQVGAFKLDYINTTATGGSNYINITGNSINAGLSSVSLIMDIYPNP